MEVCKILWQIIFIFRLNKLQRLNSIIWNCSFFKIMCEMCVEFLIEEGNLPPTVSYGRAPQPSTISLGNLREHNFHRNYARHACTISIANLLDSWAKFLSEICSIVEHNSYMKFTRHPSSNSTGIFFNSEAQFLLEICSIVEHKI